MQRVTIKPCGGGVVKDIPANELQPNEWSDALNMRFANGIAIRRDGVREGWGTPSVLPYALEAFVTSTGTRFMVYAGLEKVYANDGTTNSEITRYTDGKAISSITNATTTATLTTGTAHGLSTGNTVSVFGAFPAAYNGTFTITVTGASTFTYTMLSDPGGSATTVGQYSYNVTSNFTGDADDRWSIFVFNGVLILNHPVDGPYYWNGDVNTRMRRLPGWAAGECAYAMRPFKNYLIALGPTLAGTYNPHLIRWSASSEAGAIPTTWTASDTNDAGDTPQAAEASGYLVDGLSLGDDFILYKDDATFALQFIGLPAVFSLRRLPGKEGLHSRGCVVEIPKGAHVFMSNGDIRIHSGGSSESIAEGRIRNWINGLKDGTYSARSFLALHPAKCEVWVCFPSINESSCDVVAAWNYNDNTWGIFSIPSTTCAATGLIAAGVDSESWEDDPDPWYTDTTAWFEYLYSPNEQRLVLGLASTALGLADTGDTDLSENILWRLEKTGTTLEDNDSMKVITKSRPQISAVAGTVFLVYHATTLQASDPTIYPSAVTYTAGTSEWANRFSKQGRFLSVKYEGSSSGPVALRSYDVEFKKTGRF